MTLDIQMAVLVWYHVYFIVVTMFGSRGQWALYPPRALYPTLPYSCGDTPSRFYTLSEWASHFGVTEKHASIATHIRLMLDGFLQPSTVYNLALCITM